MASNGNGIHTALVQVSDALDRCIGGRTWKPQVLTVIVKASVWRVFFRHY